MLKITMCGIRPKKSFPYRQIESEGEATPRKGDLIVNFQRLLSPVKTFFEDGRIKSQTNSIYVLRKYAENEILAIGFDNVFRTAAQLVSKDCWLYRGYSLQGFKDYTLVAVPPRFFILAREKADFDPLELK